MARTFKTQVVNGKFIISEDAVKTWTSVDRQTAWNAARAQANPVLFIDQEGNERDLGVVFDAAAWEQAMYNGYVLYGMTMTDGHYAPADFEYWVALFRKSPRIDYNDAAPEVKDALPRYLATRR